MQVARSLLDNICAGLQGKASSEVRVLVDIKTELEGGGGGGGEGGGAEGAEGGAGKGVRIESWDKLFYTGINVV